MKNKIKTGLVLSGGGVRGFAHLGVMKALNEYGIYPEEISGVSAGAIMGALIADGHTPEQILAYFTEKRVLKYLDISIPKRGLLKLSGLARVLKVHLKAKTFEELNMPLHVCVSNLNNGKPEYFSKGKLLKIVLSSATIPILIIPLEINKVTYVDGGLLNNLPVEPFLDRAEKIIGIHVNPIGYRKDFNSLVKIAERCFHLSVLNNIKERKEKCNIFIEPQGLKKYGTLDVTKAEEIYNIGYKEGKEFLEKSLKMDKNKKINYI